MPFSRNKFSKTEQSKKVLCELKVSIPHYSANKDTFLYWKAVLNQDFVIFQGKKLYILTD